MLDSPNEEPRMNEQADLSHPWPRCPRCDASRTTRCPVCETAGTDFAEADPEYNWGMGLDEAPESASCGCMSGGCSGKPSRAAGDDSVPGEEPSDESEPTRPVLMCPTCDEPFVPEYPRRCVWCGHEFEDGYEVDVAAQPPEEATGRVIAVVIAMAVLLALMAFYFIVLV
jgi:hypothetical protein